MGSEPEMPTDITYSVHHNPNCPMPFLVRIPRGQLDFKPYHQTRDVLGFGKSFDEAYSNALATDGSEDERKNGPAQSRFEGEGEATRGGPL